MQSVANTSTQTGLERRLAREKQARKQAEALLTEKSVALYEALQQSQAAEKKLQLSLWASQESFWEWHAHNDEYVMRSFTLESQDEKAWQGSPIQLLAHIHPDDIGNLEFHWMLAVHGDQDKLEVSFRFKAGRQYLWMRLRGRVMERNEEGMALHIVGTNKDITRERKAEQSFHLMASAFASSREPMLVLTRQLKITECNQAFLSMVGIITKQQCLGTNLEKFLAESAFIREHIDSQFQLKFETFLRADAGEQIPVEISVSLFDAQNQTGAYIIATLQDISERKHNEEKLRQQAMHDELTGLKNRAGLHDTLPQITSDYECFSLIFIDLDGFKNINDTAGHEAGDTALKMVTGAMNHNFADFGEVFRWGGDEFVVMVPEISHTGLVEPCNKLISDIEANKLTVDNTELSLSASIGIAEYPIHGNSIENLLQNADAAMYQAKLAGKGQVYCYQPGLLESMQARVSMLAELKRAISSHGLEFYVQGKYDISGKLTGAELLCRWRSPLHGTVSPDVFIPLAEENGLDSQIGYQALEAACDYLSMMEVEARPVPMAVNISGRQLLSPGFADRAMALCREARIDPAMLEIEITESIFLQDEASARGALEDLKAHGFTLVLDDFGTGFSALSYLRNFSFEIVKLDRSLLHNIHRDEKSISLFNGVVAMLKSLDLFIVAEGVELAEYLPLLRQSQVDQLQGFFFDKPLPYDQFLAKHSGHYLMTGSGRF